MMFTLRRVQRGCCFSEHRHADVDPVSNAMLTSVLLSGALLPDAVEVSPREKINAGTIPTGEQFVSSMTPFKRSRRGNSLYRIPLRPTGAFQNSFYQATHVPTELKKCGHEIIFISVEAHIIPHRTSVGAPAKMAAIRPKKCSV